MWIKLLLAILCAVMIGGAIHFQPVRERALLAMPQKAGARLRLMTC